VLQDESNDRVPDIALRPIDLDDWPAVHEWASTLEGCRYQAWGPNTPAETMAFVAQAVSQWSHQPQDRYVSIAEEQRMAGGLGGELRHTMQIRDGWRDSSVFSVLANEWPALPA
jgi:RimJ/RimL family protein N-acetyltransferase